MQAPSAIAATAATSLDLHPGNGSGPLARILKSGALSPVFQPIVSMRDGSIYAHEASIRGLGAGPSNDVDALFAAAREEGLLLDFEIACASAVLARWSAMRETGRLFVNLSAAALIQTVADRSAGAILRAVRSLDLQPRMLIIQIAEHERVANVQALTAATQEIHASGAMLAIAGFGEGRSSLRLWSELQPDIVKIDRYFANGLGAHAKKVQTLRALMQIAEVFGSTLVAEGIETADDLCAVRDLGIGLGQGGFIGGPASATRAEIEPAAAELLLDQRLAAMPAMRAVSVSGRLGDLQTIAAPTVIGTTTHNELSRLFELHADLHALAIVDDNAKPIGLIDRRQFMERYAKRYFKELYGAKPCVTFANLAPRVVERQHDIEDLVRILTSQDQRYLTEGFIVTDQGRYVGLGTGDQLVRTVTESRIEAARHANPLTFLPGNIPITEHIERLLSGGLEFVACYGDLNNFKPFNDHYGYWRGDDMIRLMAKCSVAICDAQRDFVGHVGGDDFILLFQSDDWERRCEALVEDFNANAKLLYDEDGREAGGIHAEDRHGVQRFFPFTTLSIGAVRAKQGRFLAAEGVATAAAAAKHSAKQAGVGLFVRHDESLWMGLRD